MLDVPRELVTDVSELLAAQRRARGTRRNSRVLSCGKQALFVLVWFRKCEDIPVLGAGFGISRATAYRCHNEAVRVLAARAPDLHEALEQATADGWAYVILDGKIFSSDRCLEKTTSVKGDQIDLTAARAQVLGALYWAYSHLDLPTLADPGYDGAGIGVHTPVKQPAGNQVLDVDTRTRNALLRGLRCLDERGFAVLTGRWRALQHFTASPSKIGDIVKAALVLTQFEHGRRT